MPNSYDDDYPTCEETFATLRIYLGARDPVVATDLLRIEPTSTQRKGESSPGGLSCHRMSGWFLESSGEVVSRDVRRHIDWILEKIMPRKGELRTLLAMGARADVSCFWVSASGHGGPTLSPDQMSALAELELDCWFDIYGP